MCEAHQCVRYTCGHKLPRCGRCTETTTRWVSHSFEQHLTCLLFLLLRLGFQQQPFVLDWVPPPPASTHSRVGRLLAAAAGSSTACLDLQHQPQVKCQLSLTRLSTRLLPAACNPNSSLLPPTPNGRI